MNDDVNDDDQPAPPASVPATGVALPPAHPGEEFRHDISVKAILLGSGPRFARDAFGPVLAFYVGFRLGGLLPGILAASVVAVAAWVAERRRDRPGLVARLALVFVFVQAAVGLLTRSAEWYLAQPVIVNAAWGIAFIGSTVVGKPLAAMFAREMYPFPDVIVGSRTYRVAFGRVSIVWGVYQLLRAAIRLVALFGASLETFLVVQFATGAPVTAALMAWSVWYTVRLFRRSSEWGWALTPESRE